MVMTVIPVLSRNTVTSLAHHGTVPHRRLELFFYSKKNNSVQLEDTKIKTERVCSMQRTERTRVLHHSAEAGGLTLSHSRRPFRTAYLRFILIEHRYSLHSDRYAHAAWHVWTNASFYLRGLSKACITMLRAG